MSLTEILEMILETLGMTFISCAFAYLFGLPTGVLLNVTSKKGIMPCKWLNTIFSLIINILRSIPCLIVVVLLLGVVRKLFGTGTGEWYTIIIPLVVVSYGFVSRMVEQSLSEVNHGVIEAAKSMGYERVIAVFQPFTYSRTKILFDDFVKVLQIPDKCVMTEIMGSREVNTYDIYTKDLAERIPGSVWFNTFEEISDYVLSHAKSGDIILTMGCGDIYKAAKIMVNKLKER